MRIVNKNLLQFQYLSKPIKQIPNQAADNRRKNVLSSLSEHRSQETRTKAM